MGEGEIAFLIIVGIPAVAVEYALLVKLIKWILAHDHS